MSAYRGSERGLGSLGARERPSGRVLPAAFVAFLLTLATAALGLAFVRDGFAPFWPAAGMVAGIWLVTPHDLRRPVLIGVTLGLGVGNAIAGRPAVVNLMFVCANLGEAWLLGWLLERWIGARVELQALSQSVRFIAAVAVTVAVGGAFGCAALFVFADARGEFVDLWGMWIRTRGLGMLTIAPAVIALGTKRRAWFERAWRESKVTLLTLAGIAALTYVMVTYRIQGGELLAMLVLLALVHPLILLIAARSEPAWTYVALLTITLVVVWRVGHGGGVFRGSVDTAQAFLFVSSLWTLTLAVVMEQQRRARDRALISERSMLDALAAGRGFTFDFNPRQDHIVRADPEQIIAPFVTESGASFFERVLPEDRPRLQQLVQGLSPVRPMYETTYGSRRPDGRVVWLHERAVGEFDEYGALSRLQGLTMDVTPRREAEEALREADRKKDRFIATLAHELRNPLAPIRSAADLLGSRQVGAAEIGWARQVIQRQVTHMSALLDDLLDVARITRGKLELRRQWVRLDAIVDTACEVARPLIDVRQHRLVLDLAHPVPMLDADPVRLAQVISNLLTNAARYSDPGGEITLLARTRGAVVDVTVRDTGIGIPPESLEKVFQMFEQVEGTGGRSDGGLGIGLSLVKGLVELHGGTVAAHSAGPGRGSEFTVTLPCVPTSEDPSMPAEIRATAAEPAGRRILLVDDNRDAADSLALLLGLEGHDVRVAYAGRPAIEVAHEFRPEVAVLDLGLPDLSGYDVARLLRQDPALGRIELIALTGWGQEEHRKRAHEAGFDHHVTKPVDLEHLARLLQPSSPRAP
ncbi:MAG TPA: ATP-binding protein [Steroidobacteraceae bacterium]